MIEAVGLKTCEASAVQKTVWVQVSATWSKFLKNVTRPARSRVVMQILRKKLREAIQVLKFFSKAKLINLELQTQSRHKQRCLFWAKISGSEKLRTLFQLWWSHVRGLMICQ